MRSPPPSRRARPAAVGVDVVDLADPRGRGKGSDRRFLARVLDPAEAEVVAAARDPDLEVWRLWAAKEAAFKVVSKMEDAPPPFVHAAFRVQDGRVRWRDHTVPVRLESRGEALVAVAWEPAAGGPASRGERGGRHPAGVAVELDLPAGGDGRTLPPGVRWDVARGNDVDPDPGLDLESLSAHHLHASERPPVHSRPSALVRLAARRALAEALGAPEARVAVVCPGGPAGRVPPQAWLDGGPVGADVSLSHHGRFVAWAVRTEP